MNLEAFLARLEGVRRSGSGWMARCPAHDDRKPSLSICERENRILLHCHAGCSTEAVLATLGVGARELFQDDSDVERSIAAVYDYCDENGKLLFQIIRFKPKDFRLRRPDGRGGWAWNLNGVRRVLYQLPEVLQSKSVLIVEGEKDSETARALGFIATTNAGGAEAKWTDGYSASLTGKNVTIIADADEPGRKHALRIATSLFGKVESLKVVEFPDAKDLSDWVEKAGNRDALLGLIGNAPQWTPPAQMTGDGYILTRLSELLARPDVPMTYVVENLLVEGTVSCVAAKPKVGKSTFARNLCLSVSRGDDFLGLKTKQGDCIYLALEEREEDLKNDFRAMGADGSEPIYIHAAAAPAEGIATLCDLVRQRKPVLVVIDPLFRLAHIRDEKAYAETYSALGPLIDVAREADTHVLLTHHAGKSLKADAIDSPLGSTAIGGAVCTLILLKRMDSVRTIQTVQRIGQDMPENILNFDLQTRSVSLGPPKTQADIQEVIGAIVEYLKGVGEARTEPEIDDSIEGKTSLKRKALRVTVSQGLVARDGTGKRGDPFRYRFLFSCSQSCMGTREQETATAADTSIDTTDILVPSQQKLEEPLERHGEEVEL